MNRTPDIQSPVGDRTIVVANYTKLSENIRRLTPQGIQCSVFCGGTNCKYENPESWTADSLALHGIYSHWITDDILAMARPSTAVIIKKNIIQQFQSLGIKSIINLQSPKEHASCGEPLEDSGFSYDPSLFMENNIYYYNFAWKDYGDATLSELLNMIKVMAFAVTEGRVAIHCHAGLGRTGVLISCYLVYSLRVNANDAIKYVRLKRPGSVQTRGQIVCVRHFAQYILPQNITYYLKESKDKYMTEFTLQRFLKRQKIVLHGYDERNFKFLPKIIHIICERILQLCGCCTDEFSSNTLSMTNDFFCTKLHGNMHRHESIYSISSSLSENLPSSPESMKIPSCNSSYACSSLSVSPSPSEYEDPAESSPQFSDSYSDLSTLDGDEIREEIDEQLLAENKCFQELQTQKTFDESSVPKELYNTGDVLAALLQDFEEISPEERQSILQYKNDINISQFGWTRLKAETNLTTLTALMYDWVEGLKVPVLGKDSLEVVVVHYKQPEKCFKKFHLEEACLVEYLLNFLAKLQPMSKQDQDDILMRIVASLTHQTIIINDKALPTGNSIYACINQYATCFQQLAISCYKKKGNTVILGICRTVAYYIGSCLSSLPNGTHNYGKGYQKLREGTLNCTSQFFKSLLPLIDTHHRQYLEKLTLSSPGCDKNTKDSDDSDAECGFH